MNYYISDLHFFCHSQTQAGEVNYDNRPFANLDEMHAAMLQRWNEKVTNGDTVYILGDIALRGKNDALIALVAQLKGRKVLVKGNHDDLSDLRYKQLFTEICDYKEITDHCDQQAYKLVLCHYPILLWKGQHKGTILLYGHTHSSVEDTFFQKCVAEINASDELSLRRHGGQEVRAYNVGCMQPYMGYEPRTLDEIIHGCSARNEQAPSVLAWEPVADLKAELEALKAREKPLEWMFDDVFYRCPKCGKAAQEDEWVGKDRLTPYCQYCGQRLVIPSDADLKKVYDGNDEPYFEALERHLHPERYVEEGEEEQ